jgi:O-acetyl-ADP-ribose deacetylase (regulator of RNase III)
MKIYLCSRDKAQIESWKLFCGMFDFVEPTMQSILDIPAEGLVSPANSFGVMSGGIDLFYRNYFGREMETELRNKIFREFGGELLVGQATSVPIHHPSYSYTTLISAPTMRVPAVVSHTINPYLAAKAALRLAEDLKLNSITFPGLGTGTGGVSPDSCAKQISVAIEDVIINPPKEPLDVYEEQDKMYKKIVSEEWLKVQFEGDK